MSRTRSLHRALLVLVCCTLAACASAPVQEMSNARQAIRAARDAGAERVAPRELSEAQAHMERAELSLKNREYREARRQAVSARSKAVEALNAAQAAARPESR